MSTNRRSDIDIAKGFALFLVVLGHVVTMHHTIFRWIYAFHMPAFFFLSGMTFRPEKYSSCLDYIKKRGRTLVLPYFFITMTALAICTIRPYYHLAIDEYGWKHILKWIFYYGQPQQIYVGQLWFLPALLCPCCPDTGRDLYPPGRPVNPSHEPPPLEGRFRPLCCRIPDCRILRKSHKTSGKNDAIRWFSDSVFCGIKLLFRSKTQ